MKAYRILMAFFLSLALLMETFPKSLVLIDYCLNTSTYAAYCINKDNPEMECDGFCQVDEMMRHIDHQQQDQQNQGLESVTVVYTIPYLLIEDFDFQLPAVQPKYPPYCQFIPTREPNPLFKPPQKIS